MGVGEGRKGAIDHNSFSQNLVSLSRLLKIDSWEGYILSPSPVYGRGVRGEGYPNGFPASAVNVVAVLVVAAGRGL